ncbi:MAG: efflux transporter periplasmic adaptor subunit, partial [Cyanobacteria bacterium J06553_1]
TARLIPVEVTIPNQERRIGKGLLARVNFASQGDRSIVIPDTALQVTSAVTKADGIDLDSATIFVLEREGEQTKVKARQIELGKRANSAVEIISGLEPGEEFVLRSSGDLQSGDLVRLSFISESTKDQ